MFILDVLGPPLLVFLTFMAEFITAVLRPLIPLAAKIIEFIAVYLITIVDIIMALVKPVLNTIKAIVIPIVELLGKALEITIMPVLKAIDIVITGLGKMYDFIINGDILGILCSIMSNLPFIGRFFKGRATP